LSAAARGRQAFASSPIAYRLASGSFWILISTMATRALSLVSTIIVARLLGKEVYGELGIYNSTLEMVGIFTGFGLGTTATKFIAQYRSAEPARAGRVIGLVSLSSLVLSSTIAVALFFNSRFLAEEALHRASMQPLLQIGSATVIVYTLSGIMTECLAGFEAFRKNAMISFWQGLTVPMVTIPGVYFLGVYGVVIAGMTSGAVGLILGFIALRSEAVHYKVPIVFSRNIWNEWKILPNFSLPALIASILFVPVSWATNLMVVKLPNGYAEMGRYTVANQWRMVFFVMQGFLSTAMFPILSEQHSKEDKHDFVSVVGLNFRVTLLHGLPIVVALIAMSHFLALLYGAQFEDAQPIIVVLSVVSFLSFLNATVGVSLAGSGRMWTGALMNLGWGIALLASAAWLIPVYRAFGLALAMLIAYFVHSLWQIGYVELTLAPRVVSKEWKLISFSIAVIAASILCSLFTHLYAVGAILVVSSLFPVGRKWFYQLRPVLVTNS